MVTASSARWQARIATLRSQIAAGGRRPGDPEIAEEFKTEQQKKEERLKIEQQIQKEQAKGTLRVSVGERRRVLQEERGLRRTTPRDVWITGTAEQTIRGTGAPRGEIKTVVDRRVAKKEDITKHFRPDYQKYVVQPEKKEIKPREDFAKYVGEKTKELYFKAEEKVGKKVRGIIPAVTPERKEVMVERLMLLKPLTTTVPAPLFETQKQKEQRIAFERAQARIGAEAISYEVERVREKPISTIGTIALFGAIGRGIAAAKAIPIIGKVVTKVERPVSYGLGTLYTGAKGVEIYKEPARAPEIIGRGYAEVAEMGIGFGIGAKLSRPFERKILGLTFEEQLALRMEVESIKSLPKKERAEALFKIIKKTRKISIEPEEFGKRGVEGLSKKEVGVIKKYLQEEDVVLFGSAVSPTKKIGDVDLVALKPKQAAKKLAIELKESGVKDVTVKGSKVEIRGVKKIEFKKPERLQQFPLAEKPIVYKGIKMIKPREQFARKAFGAISALKGYKRRMKDIPSVTILAKKYLIAAEKKAVTPIGKAKYKGLRELELEYFRKGEIHPLKAYGILERKGLVIGEEAKLKGLFGRIVLIPKPALIQLEARAPIKQKKLTLRHELRHFEFPFAKEEKIRGMERAPLKPIDVKIMEKISPFKISTMAVLGKIGIKPKVKPKIEIKLKPKEVKPKVEEPSYLPKVEKPSRLPSKIPLKKPPSEIPPSKIPTIKPISTLPPSRLPPSEIPPSKIPTIKPISTLPPSRLPPSRLPPSRLPPSEIPPSRLPPTEKIPLKKPPKKPPIRFKFELKKDKLKPKEFGMQSYQLKKYAPTITAIAFGKIIKKTPLPLKKFTGIFERPVSLEQLRRPRKGLVFTLQAFGRRIKK